MQGTHTCINCEEPIYKGRHANDNRWYHAETMSTECDHPIQKAAPKPEPIFTPEMIGESMARHEGEHADLKKRMNGLEVLIETVEQRLESLETDVERVEEKADHPRIVMAVDPALTPVKKIEDRIARLEIDIEKAHDHPVFVDNMVRINDKFEARLAAIDAILAQLQLKLKAGYGIPPTVPSGDDMRMFPKIENLLTGGGKPMFRHFCTTHNRDFEICLFDTEVDDRYCNVGSAAKPYTWADSMKPKGE